MNNKDETIMNKDILYFIYINAIRDATLMKAFEGKKKQLQDLTVFNNVVIDEEHGILKLVNNVLKGKYTSSGDEEKYEEKYKKIFERDFLDVSKYVCDCIEKFRFGNAQKLINIMLKYVYIMTYPENAGVRKSYFKYCHCPMDTVMLEDAWEKRTVWEETCSAKYYKKDFLKSWGKEEFEIVNGDKTLPQRYKVFQSAVEKLAEERGMCPLEYDFYIWGKNNQKQV